MEKRNIKGMENIKKYGKLGKAVFNSVEEMYLENEGRFSNKDELIEGCKEHILERVEEILKEIE